MNTIDLPNLLPEDVRNIMDQVSGTLMMTDTACTSTSLNEIDQQQTRIEESQSALETLENFLNRQLGHLKSEIETVANRRKDLERHSKRCTRAYWLTKNSLVKIHPDLKS